MITVTLNEKNFIVEGHDNNEVCSRVSTVSQLALKILPITENSKREDGLTVVELSDKATKKDIENFDLFCEALTELQELYFRQMEIKNNVKKEVKKETDVKIITKEGE